MYYGKLCWWADMESWLYCCRAGIGTEVVGGALVIFFENYSESENKLVKFTAELNYILFQWVVNEQIPTREIQTGEALYISSLSAFF